MTLQTHNRLVFLVIRNHQGDVWMFKANKSGVQSSFMRDHCLRCQKRRRVLGSYLCLCSSCPPCPCMTICPEACFPSLGESIWGISTSSKPRSKRLCLELSGRKKKAPKHKVMKALRMRSKMNFSESLNVALWCGKEEAPGDRVGILRPESGRRAGVVMLWLLQWTSLGEELAGRGGVGWGGFTSAAYVVPATCTSWLSVLSHPFIDRSRSKKGLRSLSRGVTDQQENGHDHSEKKKKKIRS